MPSEGYAAVPNWIIRDTSISAYAIAVYAALASHSGKGGITPSQDTLAREARCSERKVRDALTELKELGVVTWEQRRANGNRTSNVYFLLPNGQPAPDAGSPSEPARDAGSNRQEHAAPGADKELPLEEKPEVKNTGPGSAVAAVTEGSANAQRLCELLRDRIIANGSKPPTITKAWLDAARLLVDTDHRTVHQVENMIAWCQQPGSWWQPNILSMPKLRERYDQMRLQALRDAEQHRAASAVDQGRAVDEELARREAARRQEQAWTPAALTH